MRGGAFTLEYKHFNLSGFYSHKKIDGNIISDTSENIEAYISSLPEDGLHNTLSRIAKEKTVTEQIMGGHLGYKTRIWDVGITAYFTHFNQALHKDFQLYNQFEFSGRQNFNLGVHYSYIFQNYNFFGETSLSENMGLATFNGLMLSISKQVSMVVSHRYYQRNYQSIYSSAFSQSNSSCNESGFYTGIIIKPHYKVVFSAYADVYHYPWLKYLVDAPSDGYDFMAALDFKPTKKIAMNIRYKFENSAKNTDEEDVLIHYTVPVHRQAYRFNVVYPVADYLFLCNRVDVTNYRKSPHEAEWGYLLAQDIRFASQKSPWAATFRFAVFDTPSYYSRIFTYENDVLYAYSLPSLYDKGIRYYLLLQYKAGRHIDLWLRFAQTCYTDKTLLSSGLNEIEGSNQSEIKAQIRFKF